VIFSQHFPELLKKLWPAALQNPFSARKIRQNGKNPAFLPGFPRNSQFRDST
jgi:hypothetical protein